MYGAVLFVIGPRSRRRRQGRVTPAVCRTSPPSSLRRIAVPAIAQRPGTSARFCLPTRHR